MKIDFAAVRQCLKSFDFKTLFREHLGWDNYSAQLDIPVNNQPISLNAIAEKRGFVAFVCEGHIPERAIRLKIDNQITKSAREHFVIYADKAKGQQVWQWVRREQGKPLASRDHRFDIRQSGDPLIQRLDQIAVDMDEEEVITVVEVAGRARAAFDVDKITKKFYDRFKTEHAAFLKHIKGFPKPVKVSGKEEPHPDLQWYTSLMLNRLMFVYFIQKKGFLDGDTEYLRSRLKMVQQARGKDKFLSFYRYFLLRLFHDGLGKAPDERKLDAEIEKMLGKVPFLNGGFFEVHELEQKYTEIDIPDQAFEKLFDFFDQYRWHLDERPLRADNEINPDVVGYIFEKYVNQKQMGAYYTKEDITEYISKNTVIPFLFDAAQKKCAIAFQRDGALWRLLRDNPDRYIYPAVRHGVINEDGSIVPEDALPDFVQKGMHDPKARMHDNRYNLQQAPGGDTLRLVTETWREYINRRNRCLEIREKLQSGEVHQINELITLNLDIWQFARDVIVNAEGPELLRAFWQAIIKITILDPTCGSGAFLFAALRILETLYSDCLERMAHFIEDIADKPHHPEQYSDFKKVLSQLGKHQSERYFILKAIIINNLFGVDIMEEAVEICKLRLFLKLVAQVEKVEQIEPLPDIDFNIRAGNTLVGYATEEQVRRMFTEEKTGKNIQSKLLLDSAEDDYKRFEESVELVEKAFQQFRAQQTMHGGRVTNKDKKELRTRLAKLDNELDRNLASEYGITQKNYGSKSTYEQTLITWKESHQPFHWFVEFYGIMNDGGFDVIIGNPPYVEFTQSKVAYKIRNFTTVSCGNLYAFIMERSLDILQSDGRSGLIVLIGSMCTERMSALQSIHSARCTNVWVSTYSGHTCPSILFDGVANRFAIWLCKRGKSAMQSLTSKYLKWYAAARPCLFPLLTYDASHGFNNSTLPKTGVPFVSSILSKISHQGQFLGNYLAGSSILYVYTTPIHWMKAFNFRPFFKCGNKTLSTQFKPISVCDESLDQIVALLNSSLFFLWWITHSDCYHLVSREIERFPFDINTVSNKIGQGLAKYSDKLMADIQEKSYIGTRNQRTTGRVRFQVTDPKLSKPIINEIDKILAQHYGFTDEELDFIINYDIKYRMGNAGDENGDDE